MKRILVIISLCSLFFSACDSLDLSPEDYFATGNYWSSTSLVNSNMLALHYDLRSTHEVRYFFGEARGGTSLLNTTIINTSIENTSPIKDNTFTKDATGVSDWYNLYPHIMRVNHFISEVEKGCTFLSASDRGYYLGQAYGLRAYHYFMLYRAYGGVPVIDQAKVVEGVTSAEDLYVARSTPKETLDFIKSDIAKSEEYFGSDFTFKGTSIWSKSATLMLKAETYLWSAKVPDRDQQPETNDLQIAKDALLQLVDKFTLLPNFSDVFEYSNKENKEIIMAMRFLDGEAANSAAKFAYPPTFINRVYGSNGVLMGDTLQMLNKGLYFHAFKYELFESYDAEDLRRNATFIDFYLKDKDGNVTNKGVALRKGVGIVNSSGNRVFVSDVVIYRYAEVLLMLAEIENKLGNDPSPYINQIRQRAYSVNYDPAVHAHVNGSFEENELAILFERDKEFVYEGKRWHDIRRMQDASGRALVFSPIVHYGSEQPILDYNKESYKVLWPINVGLITGDPLVEQTPVY